MGAEKEAALLEGLLLAALYMYKARPPCTPRFGCMHDATLFWGWVMPEQ